MARNASGVRSWLLVHNLGRLICSLHRQLEKMSKATPGHVGVDLAQDRRITSRRKTDFLIFPRKLPLLEKPSPKPSKRTQVPQQARAVAIMPNDLDQATAAAPKNVEITSVRIPLQTLLSQTHKALEKKAVQFKCGRPLANYRDLWLQLPSRIERHAKLRSFHPRRPWCSLQRFSDLF